MKLVIYILFLMNLVFCQDSLFWFDMSTVRDSIPKTPRILDKIFGISQLDLLDSIKNLRITTQDGFRLQIFESSSVEEANQSFEKFKRVFSDSLYLIFDAPLYKIRYGNFVLKNQAELEKNKIRKKGYKNIWIVRSRIEQDFSKDNQEY